MKGVRSGNRTPWRFRACAGRGIRRSADGHGHSSGELEGPLQRDVGPSWKLPQSSYLSPSLAIELSGNSFGMVNATGAADRLVRYTHGGGAHRAPPAATARAVA